MKLYLKFFIIAVMLAGVVNAQNSKVTTAANAIYSGELEKARVAIEEAALNEKTKGEPKTWLYRGRIYNLIALDTTGKYGSVEDPVGKALESFKIALSLDGSKNYQTDIGDELFTTYNLYFVRGANAYNAGNNEEAYLNFIKANEANVLQMEANPKTILDMGLIFNMGMMAERTNRTQEAIAIYQKIADMNYPESYLYSRLANLYSESGKKTEALKVLEAGRIAFPQDKQLMIDELNYYITNDNLDLLVDKLDKAIALDPKNTELYFVLGVTYGQLFTIYSDSARAIEKMNDASLKSGKEKMENQAVEALANAITTYDKGLAIDPARFDINLNLGALYFNQAAPITNYMNTLGLEAEAEFQRLKTQRSALLLKALPYFETAHQIDPAELETMVAMKEIYAKTENEKMVALMKEKIEGDVRGVKIGMTGEEVILKLGAPVNKTKETTQLGTSEIWIYDDLKMDLRNDKVYMITKK